MRRFAKLAGLVLAVSAGCSKNAASGTPGGDTPDLAAGVGGGEARVDGLQQARDLGRRNFTGLVAAGAVGHGPKAEIRPVDEGVLVEPVGRASMRRRAGAEAA